MNRSHADALQVDDLTVHYHGRPVLWDISLKVPKGAFVGILGPNGAGKSTLMKALLGLIQPVSGKVFFFDEELGKARGRIAYVPQRETIDWDFPITAKELVLMGRYPRKGLFGRITKQDREAAAECLERVGLSSIADRRDWPALWWAAAAAIFGSSASPRGRSLLSR